MNTNLYPQLPALISTVSEEWAGKMRSYAGKLPPNPAGAIATIWKSQDPRAHVPTKVLRHFAERMGADPASITGPDFLPDTLRNALLSGLKKAGWTDANDLTIQLLILEVEEGSSFFEKSALIHRGNLRRRIKKLKDSIPGVNTFLHPRWVALARRPFEAFASRLKEMIHTHRGGIPLGRSLPGLFRDGISPGDGPLLSSGDRDLCEQAVAKDAVAQDWGGLLGGLWFGGNPRDHALTLSAAIYKETKSDTLCRSLPTLALSCFDLERWFFLKSEEFGPACLELWGDHIIPLGPMTGFEYDWEVQICVAGLVKALEEEGWGPTDSLDIQCFLHQTNDPKATQN